MRISRRSMIEKPQVGRWVGSLARSCLRHRPCRLLAGARIFTSRLDYRTRHAPDGRCRAAHSHRSTDRGDHCLHVRQVLDDLGQVRRLAEKYEISQTRVRQIIAHVSDWLTDMLPVKSEQDIEKEKRYADRRLCA